jgi:hypothetical protein
MARHLMTEAGCLVCDASESNITGSLRVAIGQFQSSKGDCLADHPLRVGASAAGVSEAKERSKESSERANGSRDSAVPFKSNE